MIRKFRQKTILWTFFLTLTIILLYANYFYQNQSHVRRKDIVTKQYAINTKGCKIPFLEIRDEEIEDLYSDVRGYSCSNTSPLIESNTSAIYINLDALSEYGIKNVKDLECHYKEFWRVNPKAGQEDIQVKFGDPVYFTSEISVSGENYRVECRYFLRKHVDYHYFTPKKQFKYELVQSDLRADKVGSEEHIGNNDGSHQLKKDMKIKVDNQNVVLSQNGRHEKQKTLISTEQIIKDSDEKHELCCFEFQNGDQLNVIISGIDSLSRVHIRRKMPKTVEYLLENMKAIEYMGYTKVGYNTFPNLMPLLTGYSFDELVQNCWPDYDTRFDNCSILWANFTKKGYITFFGEEQSYFGLFNYLKKGFFDQQVDFYWDHFDRTSTDDIGHWYDLFRQYPLCMGPRPMYKVLLKSAEKFIENYGIKKFFLFYWQTTLAHNHIDTATLGDQDYVDHFKFLENSGILNRSLLIFLSDHGYRYGKMAETHQGRLEDRLPFIYFVLPDWFKQKYKLAFTNLEANAFKLMTTYDVFATLNHILEPEKLLDECIFMEKNSDKRSRSLFYQISDNRTCDSAGIPSHFCTCHEALPIDKFDTIVHKITNFVVKYLNNLLAQYKDCVPLILNEIVTADLVTYGDVYQSDKKTVSDYTITFKTNPGLAYFDATVRCNFCSDESDFQLTASISRLNRYENQSYCINNFNHQPYCYCKGWLESD